MYGRLEINTGKILLAYRVMIRLFLQCLGVVIFGLYMTHYIIHGMKFSFLLEDRIPGAQKLPGQGLMLMTKVSIFIFSAEVIVQDYSGTILNWTLCKVNQVVFSGVVVKIQAHL